MIFLPSHFRAWRQIMNLRFDKTVAGLLACGVVALIPAFTPSSRAADSAKSATPGISAEASAAIQQMSKTLSANDFSFQARTIRAYQDDEGQLLHIFHTMRVVVRRPDRF